MVVTKTTSPRVSLLGLVNEFFAQFPIWCNQSKLPAVADLEKILSRDFQLISNEKILVKNLPDYFNRIKFFRENYSNFDIVGPLEAPLVTDNKVALQYEIHLTGKDGESQQVYVMAIATIENDRIVRWQQVTHEKNTSNWDRSR